MGECCAFTSSKLLASERVDGEMWKRRRDNGEKSKGEGEQRKVRRGKGKGNMGDGVMRGRAKGKREKKGEGRREY